MCGDKNMGPMFTLRYSSAYKMTRWITISISNTSFYFRLMSLIMGMLFSNDKICGHTKFTVYYTLLYCLTNIQII